MFSLGFHYREELGTPPSSVLLTVMSLSHIPSLQHHRERIAPLTVEHSLLRLPSLLSNILWMAFLFLAGVFLDFAFRGILRDIWKGLGAYWACLFLD